LDVAVIKNDFRITPADEGKVFQLFVLLYELDWLDTLVCWNNIKNLFLERGLIIYILSNLVPSTPLSRGCRLFSQGVKVSTYPSLHYSSTNFDLLVNPRLCVFPSLSTIGSVVRLRFEKELLFVKPFVLF
jgi:hypothetical protein